MKNLFAFVVAAALLTTAFGANAKADMIGFSIGNSLTWDTQPALYGAGYHIASSRNLQFIHDNPNTRDNFTTSWVDALTHNSYDFVTVQPYPGTTLAQDKSIISGWAAMQPNAIIVVHEGWTFATNQANAYNDPQTATMQHSPAYFNALMAELQAANPGRDIRLNPSIEVLKLIGDDINMGIGPYTAMSQLYRDALHMSYSDGRFLMHNLMRQTLGLEFSNVGFTSGVTAVSADHQAYLLSKVAMLAPQPVAVPEPTSILLMASAAALVGVRRFRRR